MESFCETSKTKVPLSCSVLYIHKHMIRPTERGQEIACTGTKKNFKVMKVPTTPLQIFYLG